ncbi:XylR N-terminal domain-containing protein [Bacillus sp. 1NLA3E]|uniref:XylR N-terminal domain-containing protein n=1 Tax=Bacillus sp. 1NLA3E TaxID=666686 RepID=UPI000247F164|nr:XylR N-terminal domain-containing protein [Bacillus sp. 1NLA3E]AGK54550.1 PucR family transcriptional regulator [Bacillus sp. 1NLA3E]
MNTRNYLDSFLESGNTDFIGINALGILRKDLVAVLGMERVKGFLLRYSRQCGINDCKHMKENYLWEPEIELFHAGYKVNEIRGHAKLHPVKIKCNKFRDEFYFESFFNYSIEAEQHIQHFGKNNEPVCYTLMGYANGYASEYYGQDILFKEIECIGKGDSQCRFIGKLIKDWGPEINEILPLFKEENLSAELDRAYQRIKEQKKALRDALDISEKLSKILIQGGNISSVLEVLSNRLSTTVLFEDRNFNLIESFGSFSPYSFKDYFQKEKRKKLPWMKALFEEKRTIQLNIDERFGCQHERLTSPVILNNEVWAYISLIKIHGNFDEIDYVLLERANTICALHFSNERNAIETEKRIKGGFLSELLTDKPDYKSLTYRMKLMGYDLNKDHYVYMLNINEYEDKRGRLFEVNNKIIDEVNYQLNSYGKSCIVTNLLDKIIVLIPKEFLIKMKTTPKKLGELIEKTIRKKYGHSNLYLGISSLFKGLENFRKAYEESSISISIASRKESTKTIICYEDLGYLGFLLTTNNIAELEKYAKNLLSDLLIYDKKSNSEFMKTLYFLLEFQGNITLVSRKLMLSDGAVRYRLKRISEITNLDFGNTKDFLNAHLALQIYLLFGIWDLTG